MAEIKHYLGIDYGQEKVGLALADEETRLAFAYGMLKNNHSFWRKLERIIEEKKVQKVVVGIPSHKNRVEVEYASEKFADELKKKFAVEIFFQNEMFTTKMAQENLKARGMKNVGKKDDAEAARIILQEWLEKS